MGKPYGGLVVVNRTVVNMSVFDITLMSDLHVGSAQTDYGLIERDLDVALACGDRILINGDVFDNIVPGDKKYAPSKLHPRLSGKDEVTNEVLDWAYDLLWPYAGSIDLIGVGNHDHWSTQRQGFDMVRELVRRLNQLPNTNIAYAGYTGVVNYRFNMGKGKQDRLVLHYHHGAGKGKRAGAAIQALQSSVTVDNADVVWQGHFHVQTVTRERVTRMVGSRLVERDKLYVHTGSYQKGYVGYPDKEAMKGRRTNFAADSNLRPGGLGATRVHVGFEHGLRLGVTL